MIPRLGILIHDSFIYGLQSHPLIEFSYRIAEFFYIHTCNRNNKFKIS